MLEKIKTLLLGKRTYSFVFVRFVVIQSNEGAFHLWQKQPIVFRQRWKRKRNNGNKIWELQNTIAQPLFGTDDNSSPIAALKQILQSHGRKFFISYNPKEGTSSIEFTDR